MTEKSLFEKIKEAGAHTLVYGVGSVLTTLLGFILIPIYTKYYTTDIYGALALINLCGTIAGSVFYFGVHSALGRSYYDYPEGRERVRIVSTTFWILVFGALLQVSLGAIFCDELSKKLFGHYKYAVPILITVGTSAIGFLNSLFYLLLKLKRKSREVVFLNIGTLLITTFLILYMLVVRKMGIMAPVLGVFLANAILLIVLFVLAKDSLKFCFSVIEMKLQLKWGISVVLSNFGVLVLNWSDRFFVNKYCTLEDVGVYSLGYKIGMLIQILLVIPFSQIWGPMRMEYRHDKNANRFYSLVVTYYFIAGLLISLGLSIFSKELLTLMVSRSEYIEAYKVVPFVVFSYLLVYSNAVTDHGITFERKVHYGIWISWFFAGVNCLLNYIFIPRYGYMVAAYTTLVSYLMARAVGLVISNHLYKIPYEKKRLLLLFISSFAALALAALSPQNIWGAVGFKIVLMVALLTFWYVCVITVEEKEKIHSLIGWR